MRYKYRKIGYSIIIAIIIFIAVRSKIDLTGTNHSRLDTTDSPLGFLLVLLLCAIPIYLIHLFGKKLK